MWVRARRTRTSRAQGASGLRNWKSYVLVREMIGGSPWPHLKWLLHTKDAHGLYRKLGFAAPDARVMERLPPA